MDDTVHTLPATATNGSLVVIVAATTGEVVSTTGTMMMMMTMNSFVVKQSINSKHKHPCLRYATIPSNWGDAGLEYRIEFIVFGMKFAQETNSTYVLDYDTIWSRNGQHGNYSWLLKFLPLYELKITTKNHPTYYDAVINQQQQKGTISST